jgi:hypothetical protein
VAAGKLAVGVEINGTGLRIALVSLKPVPTILHCEEIEVQAGDEARIGTLIARVLDQFGARRADVHIVFSPPQPAPGRHHIFTAPKLRRSELVQVAMRELKRDGTLDPNNSYFSVDSLGPDEADSKAQRYLMVALAKEPVDIIATSILQSKLVLRTASTTAMGLMRVTQATDIPLTGIVALAQLDIRRSTLLVLDNGVPRFFRDIPTSFAKGGREGADDALIAQALARELDISLVFFAQQHRPKQVDTIMIVGDAEVADRVSEWLEDSQTYKVIRFGPTEKLRVEPSVQPNLLPYAAAIGATLTPKRGGAATDLLPTQLRGHPERLIATAIAGIATILVMSVVIQGVSRAATETQQQGVRVTSLRTQFDDVQRRVTTTSAIDEDGTHADNWKTFLENADLYQKKIGNLVYALERTVPPRGRINIASLGDLAPKGSRLSPAQIARDGNLRMHIGGSVRSPDLQLAQADVLKIFHSTETLTPDIVHSTLTPLVQVPGTNGIVELPFQIDMNVNSVFPGPR